MTVGIFFISIDIFQAQLRASVFLALEEQEGAEVCILFKFCRRHLHFVDRDTWFLFSVCIVSALLKIQERGQPRPTNFWFHHSTMCNKHYALLGWAKILILAESVGEVSVY